MSEDIDIDIEDVFNKDLLTQKIEDIFPEYGTWGNDTQLAILETYGYMMNNNISPDNSLIFLRRIVDSIKKEYQN